MSKSSESASKGKASTPGEKPQPRLAGDPTALRRAHAAAHRFVEQLEAEIEAAVDAARARQLAAIRSVEQTGRYLYCRHPLADQRVGARPRKPKGLTVEPDFILALQLLDALPLAGCLDKLRDIIVALEPYEGKPFGRKPLVLRHSRVAGGPASATTGAEETALADLEHAADDLLELFRRLVKRLAASRTTKTARRKKPKDESSGMLTPPQVAKRLGVSADKIRAWIDNGADDGLHAVDVASPGSSRPRWRISEENLAKFQQKRQNVKPPKPATRRKKDPNVIEFFK